MTSKQGDLLLTHRQKSAGCLAPISVGIARAADLVGKGGGEGDAADRSAANNIHRGKGDEREEDGYPS